MKRRTRLASSPVKVFGCHVYPLDGSRTKVHIKSFRTVSEAREFALTMVEAMRKLPRIPDMLKVELSGIVNQPGGLNEEITIYGNPDCFDFEGS